MFISCIFIMLIKYKIYTKISNIYTEIPTMTHQSINCIHRNINYDTKVYNIQIYQSIPIKTKVLNYNNKR